MSAINHNKHFEDAVAVVTHHLHLFGISPNYFTEQPSRIEILYRPTKVQSDIAKQAIQSGTLVIAIQPQADFSAEFGVIQQEKALAPLQFKTMVENSKLALRTLHSWMLFKTQDSFEPLLCNEQDEVVWLWLAQNKGELLFIGTDLAADLIRYRQGDPLCALNSSSVPQWGFDNERPLYLFEPQLEGQPKYARFADNWAEFIANFIAHKANIKRMPILPGGAKGAVIITGDDDQADLKTYQAQLKLLSDTPITYFMHPLTKHTQQTIGKMLNRPNIDLGIHPDALDSPQNYAQLFSEQVAWFRQHFNCAPTSVRNHGFLNDKYWGHLPAWIKEDVQFSSNIPGLDGRVLNGSLLPARVSYAGKLTMHWSILTAIGDGILFVLKQNKKQSAQCVYDLADAILQSDIPGVIVLNLHPENIDKSRSMHYAALDLIKQGFYPWTMNECQRWFCQRDGQQVNSLEITKEFVKNSLFKKISQSMSRLVGLSK